MKKNFWQTTSRPILALAPMAGFTNRVFRRLCGQLGADVLYSEMASATALFYGKLAAKKTLDLLQPATGEKNYVVQLFGSQPEHFVFATRLITKKLPVAGFDINCGCPVSKVIKQGAGADLMKNPQRSRKIIEAVLANTDLPVSIKIRASAGSIQAEEFLAQLADLPISAVMVHGRSLEQGFTGQVDVKIIQRLRKIYSGPLLINGGINNLVGAQKILKDSQADGLGLARGILGRPWLFREIKNNQEEIWSLPEITKFMIKHTQLVAKEFGQPGILELRKHLCWYVQGLPQASAWRQQLVKVETVADLKKFLNQLIYDFKY